MSVPQFVPPWGWAQAMLGLTWPAGDEDALRRCGNAWQEAAGSLLRAAGHGDDVVAKVNSAIISASCDQFNEYWKRYVQSDGILDQLAGQCAAMANYADSSALELEATKISMNVVAVILYIQILEALLEIAASFGLDTPLVAAQMAAERWAAQSALRMLLKSLIEALAFTLLPDLIAESVQMVEGNRPWGDFDGSRLMHDLEHGLVLGGLFALPGLGGRMAKNFDWGMPAMLKPAFDNAVARNPFVRKGGGVLYGGLANVAGNAAAYYADQGIQGLGVKNWAQGETGPFAGWDKAMLQGMVLGGIHGAKDYAKEQIATPRLSIDTTGGDSLLLHRFGGGISLDGADQLTVYRAPTQPRQEPALVGRGSFNGDSGVLTVRAKDGTTTDYQAQRVQTLDRGGTVTGGAVYRPTDSGGSVYQASSVVAHGGGRGPIPDNVSQQYDPNGGYQGTAVRGGSSPDAPVYDPNLRPVDPGAAHVFQPGQDAQVVVAGDGQTVPAGFNRPLGTNEAAVYNYDTGALQQVHSYPGGDHPGLPADQTVHPGQQAVYNADGSFQGVQPLNDFLRPQGVQGDLSAAHQRAANGIGTETAADPGAAGRQPVAHLPTAPDRTAVPGDVSQDGTYQGQNDLAQIQQQYAMAHQLSTPPPDDQVRRFELQLGGGRPDGDQAVTALDGATAQRERELVGAGATQATVTAVAGARDVPTGGGDSGPGRGGRSDGVGHPGDHGGGGDAPDTGGNDGQAGGGHGSPADRGAVNADRLTHAVPPTHEVHPALAEDHRPPDHYDIPEQVDWARRIYEAARRNPDDVAAIVEHLSEVPREDGGTGYTRAEIARIHEHLFVAAHDLGDGGLPARFDEDPDIAAAWQRLSTGRAEPHDLTLLDHEIAEARYLETHPDATHEEAHREANRVADWEGTLAPGERQALYDDYVRDDHGDPGVLREGGRGPADDPLPLGRQPGHDGPGAGAGERNRTAVAGRGAADHPADGGRAQDLHPQGGQRELAGAGHDGQLTPDPRPFTSGGARDPEPRRSADEPSQHPDEQPFVVTTDREARIGAHLLNDPASRAAARDAVARMREVLRALNPGAHEAVDAMFLNDDPTSAGQVGPGVSIDALLADGNTRELMTALYNASFLSGAPTDLVHSLLRTAATGEAGWRTMHDIGIDTAALAGYLEFVARAKGFEAGDPSYHGQLTGRDFTNKDHLAGYFGRHGDEAARDLAIDLLRQKRPADARDLYTVTRGDLQRLGVDLGRFELAYQARLLGRVPDHETALPWVTGQASFVPDHLTEWYEKVVSDLGMPVLTGPSGSAARLHVLNELLDPGGDHEAFLGAMTGWMLAGRDHSSYEIVQALRGVGYAKDGAPAKLAEPADLYQAVPGLKVWPLDGPGAGAGHDGPGRQPTTQDHGTGRPAGPGADTPPVPGGETPVPPPEGPTWGIPEFPRTLPDGDPLLQVTYTIDTPTRQAFRQGLIEKALAGATPPEDGRPVLYLMGGGVASGKSTLLHMLQDSGEVPTENVAFLSPDEFKEPIPEYKLIIMAGDSMASSAVQSESGIMFGTARDEAIQRGINIICDVTLGNPAGGLRTIQKAIDAGYEVRLYGVTADAATAVVRNADRAASTGRYVPIDVLLSAHKGFSEGFRAYADAVDHAELWDNSGSGAPTLIAGKASGGGLEVRDDRAFAAFERKAGLDPSAAGPDGLFPRDAQDSATSVAGQHPDVVARTDQTGRADQTSADQTGRTDQTSTDQADHQEPTGHTDQSGHTDRTGHQDQTARADQTRHPDQTVVGDHPGHPVHPDLAENPRPADVHDIPAQVDWARQVYDAVRENPHDVGALVRHLADVPRPDGTVGFTRAEVEAVLNHLFVAEHSLPAGHDGSETVTARFDVDPDVAAAWQRMSTGETRPEDVLLMEHELAEMKYREAHPDATHDEAHQAANDVANWESTLAPGPRRALADFIEQRHGLPDHAATRPFRSGGGSSEHPSGHQTDPPPDEQTRHHPEPRPDIPPAPTPAVHDVLGDAFTSDRYRHALTDRAREVARQNGTTPEVELQQFVLLRAVSRIFAQEPDAWLLKGGLSFLARFPDGRPTTDLDFIRLTEGGVERMAEDYNAALNRDHGDGLRFVFDSSQPVAGGRGVRIGHRVFLGDEELMPLSVDLVPNRTVPGRPESETLWRSEEHPFPDQLFRFEGANEPQSIRILSLDGFLRQKLAAMYTYDKAAGLLPRRPNDLVDLALLAVKTSWDGPATHASVREEFDIRWEQGEMLHLPEEFANPNPAWVRVFAERSATTPGLPFMRLPEALPLLKKFIDPFLRTDPPNADWDHRVMDWVPRDRGPADGTGADRGAVDQNAADRGAVDSGGKVVAPLTRTVRAEPGAVDPAEVKLIAATGDGPPSTVFAEPSRIPEWDRLAAGGEGGVAARVADVLADPTLPTLQAKLDRIDQGVLPVAELPSRIENLDSKNLRFYSYMAGELFIHSSALMTDPHTTIEVGYHRGQVYRDYSKEAEARQLSYSGELPDGMTREQAAAVALWRSTKGLPVTDVPPAELVHNLLTMHAQPLVDALTMRDRMINEYGIAPERIRLAYGGAPAEDPGRGKSQTTRAHIHALAALRDDPQGARETMVRAMTGTGDAAVARDARAQAVVDRIDAAAARLGRPADKIALLWVRDQRANPTANRNGLDTQPGVLRQLIELTRAEDPERHIVLVGDDIFLNRTGLREAWENDGVLTGVDTTTMVKFWDRARNDGQALGPGEQALVFGKLLGTRDVVQIGTESGALEIPFLLGTPTVYLENLVFHLNKGNRWLYMSQEWHYGRFEVDQSPSGGVRLDAAGHPVRIFHAAGDPLPAPLPTVARVQFGPDLPLPKDRQDVPKDFPQQRVALTADRAYRLVESGELDNWASRLGYDTSASDGGSAPWTAEQWKRSEYYADQVQRWLHTEATPEDVSRKWDAIRLALRGVLDPGFTVDPEIPNETLVHPYFTLHTDHGVPSSEADLLARAYSAAPGERGAAVVAVLKTLLGDQSLRERAVRDELLFQLSAAELQDLRDAVARVLAAGGRPTWGVAASGSDGASESSDSPGDAQSG